MAKKPETPDPANMVPDPVVVATDPEVTTEVESAEPVALEPRQWTESEIMGHLLAGVAVPTSFDMKELAATAKENEPGNLSQLVGGKVMGVIQAGEVMGLRIVADGAIFDCYFVDQPMGTEPGFAMVMKPSK